MSATPSTTGAHGSYTHGYGDAVLNSHRHRTAQNSAAHLLPHLREGQRLLDVGSGAGTITADLARIVGPENLVALEVREEAAAITRAELQAQGLEQTEVVVGDAHDLPFESGSFDVVHAHQVLQHVADPVTVLAQMRRVTSEGGLVSVRDSDYEAFRWYPDVPALDRWRELYLRAARQNGGTPDAGRRLLAWAHQVGFTEVTPLASTQLYATPEGRAAWAGAWVGRITGAPLGEQIVREGWADAAELASIAEAWTTWANDPDGWFTLLHAEILARP
ncbi:methyltransferase domain-containing protein [Brachybacterium muris]|uniref:methyltransferase domain-containing protein n=1 Tax=Brachybacterium muris TaxID=219301 RepID=UPI00195C64EA|nr:methyltransferase domain-containing protein [Brachybacterium muris]MBM7502498.1 ubiquinone/menaquinone biosynthesis C-methylase UbiE [Brachybacterium muris]MCT1997474.1 methyltransferase domain-containing protein [Brachybacterium muris]